MKIQTLNLKRKTAFTFKKPAGQFGEANPASDTTNTIITTLLTTTTTSTH
jgi:hypothetical protein